jgi:hypothetical protein
VTAGVAWDCEARAGAGGRLDRGIIFWQDDVGDGGSAAGASWTNPKAPKCRTVWISCAGKKPSDNRASRHRRSQRFERDVLKVGSRTAPVG